MTAAVRDARRSDTYAAEDAAFEGTVVAAAPGGPALEGAIDTILASRWWRTEVGDPAIVRAVRVRTARDSHWAAATGTLAIDPAEPWYVVTHELAHVAVTLAARRDAAPRPSSPPPTATETPGVAATAVGPGGAIEAHGAGMAVGPGGAIEAHGAGMAFGPGGAIEAHGAGMAVRPDAAIEAHGAVWRAWNVAISGAVFGEPFGALLAASFARFGLAVEPPPAAAPPSPLLAVAAGPPARGGWRPSP